MSQTHTVTINGRQYDAVTGLAVDGTAAITDTPSFDRPKKITHSHNVHTTTQRSQTLNRRHTQKPAAPLSAPSLATAPVRHRQTVPRSAAISKFAAHPSPQKNHPRTMNDIAPKPHPAAYRAQAAQASRAHTTVAAAPAAPKPAQMIKQEAIHNALQTTSTQSADKKTTKKTRQPHSPRLFSVASASLAVLLLGGYFTYLNMPSLSVRVAAAQAGINASFPEYRPDGYSLRGAVAYKEGEVSMQFAANAGPQKYTVTQTKSSFDSAAVLDNEVRPATGGQFTTYNERGLTIYTYDSNAAWVNGGILYTIKGDAPLSGEQIRRIATSL